MKRRDNDPQLSKLRRRKHKFELHPSAKGELRYKPPVRHVKRRTPEEM